MRPLPRLHAVTDESVLALEDLGTRAAAIASAGPAVALHARGRELTGAALSELTRRFLSLAGPPEASVFVNGRADIARALSAQGVQLSGADPAPRDARLVLGPEWKGWVGRSVHSLAEAAEASAEGADFLMVGTVYPTETHPGVTAGGLDLVEAAAGLGRPVIAIGGITPERAPEVRRAGAYGVAVIRAAWHADDPARAALALLEPWTGDS